MSSIFMYWNSQTKGYILCYEDQEKTIPMNLENKALILIAKRKIVDADDDAIFTLSLGEGLTLDNVILHNKVSFIIAPASTLELPRTKNTTIWCELLANPDEEDRQTIEQFALPVKISVKDAVEA